MKSCMNFKTTCSRITFVAAPKSACERLLTGVGQLVGLQMPFSYKLVLANRATERTFTSMRAHVCFQVASLRKLFEATLVWTK